MLKYTIYFTLEVIKIRTVIKPGDKYDTFFESFKEAWTFLQAQNKS